MSVSFIAYCLFRLLLIILVQFRSVYLLYQNDEFFDKLPARRLILPRAVLEDFTESPENECFCLDINDETKCPYTGAIFTGACYEGLLL